MVALHVDNKKVSVFFLFKMKRAFTCSIYTSLKTKILTTMKLIDSTSFGMFNLQFTICLQVMTQPKNLFNLDLNFIEIHFVFVFVFGFFFCLPLKYCFWYQTWTLRKTQHYRTPLRNKREWCNKTVSPGICLILCVIIYEIFA